MSLAIAGVSENEKPQTETPAGPTSLADFAALGIAISLGADGGLQVRGLRDAIQMQSDCIKAAKAGLLDELQRRAADLRTAPPLSALHPGLFLSDPSLGEPVSVPPCPSCGSLDAWQGLRSPAGGSSEQWRCRRCDPPGFRPKSCGRT